MVKRLRARLAYPHDVLWYVYTGLALSEEWCRDHLSRKR